MIVVEGIEVVFVLKVKVIDVGEKIKLVEEFVYVGGNEVDKVEEFEILLVEGYEMKL